MNKTLYKLLTVLRKMFVLITIITFLLSTYYMLLKPPGFGDESLFLKNLDSIINIGWYNAIAENISIPYMLLAYPLSLIFENFIALRIVNVLLLLLFLFYFYKRTTYSYMFYVYLLFFLCTTGVFITGTNDALFFITLTIFFHEVFLLSINKQPNYILAFLTLVIAFFTRELFILYLPMIILACYIIYIKGMVKLKMFYYPICLIGLFMLINVPSLLESNKLSFDRKLPPENIESTWVQRQYLAQLLVNSGKIKNKTHPSWLQTDLYLEENGKESLPQKIIESLFFDVKLTIKEFCKDFIDSFFYSFRKIGLMILIPIFLFIRNIILRKNVELSFFIPFSTLLVISIFSLLIISYIELRWYFPILLMSIVKYYDIQKNKEIPMSWVSINYILLLSLGLYGSSNLIMKLI